MLDKVKNYLIIPLEFDDEDQFLVDLIEAAKIELAATGVREKQTEQFKALYELAICMLVCFWHEHRDEQGNIPPGVIGIVNQLRYSGGEEVED